MTAWLTSPGDLGRYRRWSVVAGIVTFGYAVIRAPVLIDPGHTWEPVGVARLLNAPLPAGALVVLWLVTLLFAVQLMIHRESRMSEIVRIVGALCALVLFTHRSSLGQILWFDTLMTLHLLTLGAAAGASRFVPPDVARGWALRLAALTTVATYVVAGAAKVRVGGLSWVTQGALEGHIAFSSTRLELLGGTPSPISGPFLDLGALSTPLAIGVIALELGAPVALLGRRSALVWSVAIWVMHAFIAASMFVIFHWPLFGAAFIPLLCQPGRPLAQ